MATPTAATTEARASERLSAAPTLSHATQSTLSHCHCDWHLACGSFKEISLAESVDCGEAKLKAASSTSTKAASTTSATMSTTSTSSTTSTTRTTTLKLGIPTFKTGVL